MAFKVLTGWPQPREVTKPADWRQRDRQRTVLGAILVAAYTLVAPFSAYRSYELLRGTIDSPHFISLMSISLMAVSVVMGKVEHRVPWRAYWAVWFGYTMVAELEHFEQDSPRGLLYDEPGRREIEEWCRVSLRGPWTALPALGWRYVKILRKKDAALFRLRFG